MVVLPVVVAAILSFPIAFYAEVTPFDTKGILALIGLSFPGGVLTVLWVNRKEFGYMKDTTTKDAARHFAGETIAGVVLVFWALWLMTFLYNTLA